MNLEKLRAAFSKNRLALGGLGAVAVAALAWRARSEKSTGTDAPAGDVTRPAGTSATPSYYTATGAYDSTATDIYNAIQPQLEELRTIASKIPVPGSETTPAEAPSMPNGYYQAAGDQAVFKYDDGNLDFLTFGEYQALGSPAYTQVSRDDPFWGKSKVLDAGVTLPWVKK